MVLTKSSAGYGLIFIDFDELGRRIGATIGATIGASGLKFWVRDWVRGPEILGPGLGPGV
jgi:hypothetical protein